MIMNLKCFIFLQRVIHQRILPHLFLEFPNHAMIPFVLPNVLLIAEDCTTQEFVDLVLPELKKIFTVQEPVQVLFLISVNSSSIICSPFNPSAFL